MGRSCYRVVTGTKIDEPGFGVRLVDAIDMKTTKLDTSGVFEPVKVTANELELSLPAHSVHLRNNGIEFLSTKEVPMWTELTIDLQSPNQDGRINCTGIVVGSTGNKHNGYVVSIIFMGITPEAQERLSSLVQTQPTL